METMTPFIFMLIGFILFITPGIIAANDGVESEKDVEDWLDSKTSLQVGWVLISIKLGVSFFIFGLIFLLFGVPFA